MGEQQQDLSERSDDEIRQMQELGSHDANREAQRRAGEQADGAEWPSREQMARVAEHAADGKSVKVERFAPDSDLVRISSGHSREHVYDVDGHDVGEEVLHPTTLHVALPLDLVRQLLGDERVDEALAEAHRRHGWSHTTQFALGDELKVDLAAALRRAAEPTISETAR